VPVVAIHPTRTDGAGHDRFSPPNLGTSVLESVDSTGLNKDRTKVVLPSLRMTQPQHAQLFRQPNRLLERGLLGYSARRLGAVMNVPKGRNDEAAQSE
jgi:hypothetical protein